MAVIVLVQGWITATPLTECRGVGMSAHVESAGAHGHFAHDESSCPACVVLALNAFVPRVERLTELPRLSTARIMAGVTDADGRPSPARRSRAPPLAC